MHPSCEAFVAYQVARLGPFRRVLEIGSRDINGTIRPLFEESEEYVGIDVLEGPGVDRIIHAADLGGEARYDCVVSTNAAEHDDRFPDTLAAAYRLLRTGGVLILSAAGPWFGPHSGLDELPIRPWEHYEHITEDRMREWVEVLPWASSVVADNGMDITVVAVK